MNTYEELAVLEQGEDGAVVSIRGQDGPCVLLGAKYLGHLAFVLQGAERSLESLKGWPERQRMETLCSEIRTLLHEYDNTCVKFLAEKSAPKSMAQLLEEVDELRRQLQRGG